MTEAPPAWALGYPMPLLQEGARLFKAELGPHCHGAFGLPKEREIALAMDEHGAIWTLDKSRLEKPMEAIALFRVLKSASAHEDFAGRIAHPQAGDFIIRAIAGSSAGKRRLIASLSGIGVPIWVEGHVENSELAEFMEMAGFYRVMVKVSASSDLKGLWLRASDSQLASRLPPKLHAADAPALAILRENFISAEEARGILDEAEAFAAGLGRDAFADHYSGYNKRKSWSALALRGFDASPDFIEKPAEMSKAWKADHPEKLAAICSPTTAAPHFPLALEIASRIPGAKQRIRLMRLSPRGGELTRHADITDPQAGTGPGKVARLHIPLMTSPECRFRGWGLDGRHIERHFPARALCYLDTRKPHAARNDGGLERIHLVIDTFAGDDLRAMIAGAGVPSSAPEAWPQSSAGE